TAAGFLESRDVRFVAFAGLNDMLDAYEREDVDAIVFDAPILAYYVNQGPVRPSTFVGRSFLPENYGIALTSGSDLAEPINQSLLRLRESGEYASLIRKWFGDAN
ncbi:MAG: transporter substrate-binding domain-containing protein, partial [Pseudomonadota bacterium]